LAAGLLPAFFVSTAVAQTSTNTPIFQFGIFYNVDLEINPGAPFTINGRVHCNTNIYCTGSSPSQPVTFLSSVDAAGTISNTPSPLDPVNGPSGGNRSGNVVFSGGSPIAHSDTLNLPLGTSPTNYTCAAIESLLKMPPATYALGTAAAYTATGQNYFANQADLIITNDATGTNITVLYQNQYNSPNFLIIVAPDAMGVYSNGVSYHTNQITHRIDATNTIWVTNFCYSYVTNVTFYDYRETNTVRALQIDVARLGAWLSNTNSLNGGWQYEQMNTDTGGGTDKGHVINSIYVYNSVARTASQLPAVRLVNGAQLPTNACNSYPASGLGIATAMPIYVKGHYNITTNGVNFAYTLGSTTNNTLPAALIGDAVTILSGSWNDAAYVSGYALASRPAVNTTINAACFVGIVPSNGSYYSGGLENFLRLLESWNGDILTYNGSTVAMFPSMYATNKWMMAGNYYTAPARAWGFDTNFLNLSKLPPFTPWVVGNTPVITTQPQSQTVTLSNTAVFSVSAIGYPSLSFQWRFNGTNLAGATNTSLTLSNVRTNQAGNYAVLVANVFGSVLSSNAVLTVSIPPDITAQPVSQAALSGSNVTLSVTVTGTGPVYYQWYLNGTGCYPYPIVAGTGIAGYSGDNGPATNAMLSSPSGLTIDNRGNLYIVDSDNNRIRKVDTNGIITTVAGNGAAGFGGDGYRATNASLWDPGSVTVDPAGDLYIADSANGRIRKVDTNGMITTVAGDGGQGFSGDGGPATAATFLDPEDVVVDAFGNLYISDYYNNRVRRVDTNGIITTVAGNGSNSYSGDGGPATNASLARPLGVAADVAGNLYIADRNNNRIRKVDTNGIITTVAGNGILGLPAIGGAATNTSLACPDSIAVDAVGNLYIAGYTNYCILRVDTNGIITAVPTAIHSLGFVAVDAAGNLYYDDTMVNQTRRKTFMGPTLTLTDVDLSDAGSYFVTIITPYGNVISSNAVLSVYSTAAATLNSCSFSCVNGFEFQVAGVPGFNYAVQESTNLIDWVSLITNTSPFIFTDANATNSSQQFYRTLYVP